MDRVTNMEGLRLEPRSASIDCNATGCTGRQALSQDMMRASSIAYSLGVSSPPLPRLLRSKSAFPFFTIHTKPW